MPSVMIEGRLDRLGTHARLLRTGKVREMYEIGDDLLLMVATDRVSAFDVVMSEGIPRKGEVLTRMSAYWFDRTSVVVPNHMVAVLEESNAAEYGLHGIDPAFLGRSMVVRKAAPLPVECVVRGYIAGSGWTEYQRNGTVTGIPLPEGLQQSGRLFEPIFTPTSKAQTGHDMPMTFEEVVDLIGEEHANVLRLRSLAIYRYAADVALQRGIIIADTKFEFGLLNGEPIVIDEMLTPDSSRFWPADRYQAGQDQPSFDKQPLRDYLSSTGWGKEPPPPPLPDEVVRATSERYQEAFQLITGEPLPPASV